MANVISPAEDRKFVYHVLRYTSDLVRDEWVNIGVLLFDPWIASFTRTLQLALPPGRLSPQSLQR